MSMGQNPDRFVAASAPTEQYGPEERAALAEWLKDAPEEVATRILTASINNHWNVDQTAAAIDAARQEAKFAALQAVPEPITIDQPTAAHSFAGMVDMATLQQFNQSVGQFNTPEVAQLEAPKEGPAGPASAPRTQVASIDKNSGGRNA